MDIFRRWFQRDKLKHQELTAFATGMMCPLSESPDEAFAGLMMGDGLAIRPEEGTIVAPLDGKITMIFPTKHVFGLTTAEGIELMIHIGIDTVNLKGQGYHYLKQQQDTVRSGEVIAKVDLDLLAKNGYDPIVMMIVVNPNGYTFTYNQNGPVNKGETLIAHYQR